MFATGATVGLAEWIIDDIYLVSIVLTEKGHSLRIVSPYTQCIEKGRQEDNFVYIVNT